MTPEFMRAALENVRKRGSSWINRGAVCVRCVQYMVNLKLPTIHAEWELLSLLFRLSNGGAEGLRSVPKPLRVIGGTGKQTA